MSVPLSRPVTVPEPEPAEGRVIISLLTGPCPGSRCHSVVPDGGAQSVILEHHEQEQAAKDDSQADQHNLGGVRRPIALFDDWRVSGSLSIVTILGHCGGNNNR